MGVCAYLEQEIAKGNLHHDEAQQACGQSFDQLLGELSGYSAQKNGLFRSKQIPPQGLYIWGGVGRGKSMLMDVFFEHVTQARKKRVHFHAFMQDVHASVNRWRKMSTKERRKSPHYVKGAKDDPIAPTAKSIALSADVLCFDEFHVTDIADAMILSRLFTALLARGVVVIATSNRPPDDLYKDGLNRGLFLPFLELLKQKLVIYPFESETDHRLRKLTQASVYYTPLNETSKAELEHTWNRLIRPLAAQEQVVKVQGRRIVLSGTPTVVRARFSDLCDRALGAADYLEIARSFSTLIVENVPKMGPENRNEAKRFVTLIDAIYEARTKLILSAEVGINDLYPSGDGAFEFERTVSRLIEMQSSEYLGAEHEVEADNMAKTPPSSSLFLGLKALLIDRLNIFQIMRYGFVGVGAASTHATTAIGLKHGLNFDPTASNFGGFIAGAIISYLGSFYFTFAQKKASTNTSPKRSHKNTMPRFIVVWLIGIGINVGLFKYMVDNFTMPFWLSVLIAIVITPIAQYLMLRFYAFKE